MMTALQEGIFVTYSLIIIYIKLLNKYLNMSLTSQICDCEAAPTVVYIYL